MKKVYNQICFITILFSIQTVFGQHFPAPTGKYKVGIASFVLQDTSRYDSVVCSYRPIMVKVWYPCSSNAASQPADYVIDDGLKKALLKVRYFDQDSITLVKMNRLKSNSFFEVPFYKKRQLSADFLLARVGSYLYQLYIDYRGSG